MTPDRPQPRRLRSLVWLAAVLVLAAAFYAVLRSKRDLVDFEVYRTAGARVMQAAPLYRPEDGHYQFKYLPASALLFAPAAWPPPEIAKGLWFALSVALLVVFLRGSVRALPRRRRSLAWLGWMTLLLTGKFLVKELALGQANLLLAIVLGAAVLALQRGRLTAAGVLVGLGVFVKPYAVVLVPWLALTGGAAPAAVSACVVAAGLALPAVVYGWYGNAHLLAAWFATVTGTTPENLQFPENISLAAMWIKWLGSDVWATRLTLATDLAAVGLGVAVCLRRRAIERPAYLEFGLLMLLVPLLSPQGWDYGLLLALPAYVCLLDRFGELPGGWRAAAAAGFALTSFTIFDLIGRALYMRLMDLSVVSVGVLLLVASLVKLRWQAMA